MIKDDDDLDSSVAKEEEFDIDRINNIEEESFFKRKDEDINIFKLLYNK